MRSSNVLTKAADPPTGYPVCRSRGSGTVDSKASVRGRAAGVESLRQGHGVTGGIGR